MLLPDDQYRQDLSAMQAPVRVLAAVVFRGSRVLVAQRAGHKRHGGLWEFPGGKMEPGETHFEAARRELAEELQLNVLLTGNHLVSFRDPGSPFLIEFVEVTVEGDPNPTEHQAVAWVEKAHLSAYSMAPADRWFADWMGTTTR